MPRIIGRPRSGASSRLQQFNTNRSGNNFKSEGTGIRRHNFQANIASGNMAIDSGNWLGINGVLFKRTFDTGPDDDPVPTASNNYDTPNVMNGSNVYNFQSSIKIQNEGAQPHYFNIYQVSLSFGDTEYTRSVYTTKFPYTMQPSGSLDSGRVTHTTPEDNIFTDSVWRSFVGLQRHGG